MRKHVSKKTLKSVHWMGIFIETPNKPDWNSGSYISKMLTVKYSPFFFNYYESAQAWIINWSRSCKDGLYLVKQKKRSQVVTSSELLFNASIKSVLERVF